MKLFLIFTPIPGEMIQFYEHIFHMGWGKKPPSSKTHPIEKENHLPNLNVWFVFQGVSSAIVLIKGRCSGRWLCARRNRRSRAGPAGNAQLRGDPFFGRGEENGCVFFFSRL